ncbi:MAG TPA: DEAD/DEAH box helicase [Gammaproteobacteria bacterium]|nr:DEAD/DEAH box helicase [Gammaproteobacteria bacterium]
MGLNFFHPATAAWFKRAFGQPTPAQAEAWPAIKARGHTLIAAPTGSGKTLAAFLAAIDDLVREGLEHELPAETRVLYVSPLKALSNDIRANLEAPLEGIRAELEGACSPLPSREGRGVMAPEGASPELALQPTNVPDIHAWVRTGDTPSSERAKMARKPPHIVVTTPESLYLLLTSESGRRMLATVRTVIVDEIHALAGNKRGAHLALSLERLGALCGKPPVRVGLSATQKPIETMAQFLTGGEPCRIVDTGHVRERDLALEVPRSPLSAVMANEVWTETYDRLAELIGTHRTTLIFVNTRRLAERAARHLAERLGEDAVTAHHGSLSKEHRLDAEQRLKHGKLKALIATASLELGIDIGNVDLVCQLGTPRSIGAFLQRVGRSGHGVGRTPKGRLFPLSRDDLVECTALLEAVRRDELDLIRIPAAPRDVLAQQIVAEVANGEWREDELFAMLTRAWPYRELPRAEFEALVKMLAEGYSTRRGRHGAYLHRDIINGMLRPRRSARMTALMNGGVIPDQFDYEVVLSPDGLRVGTLNEDFAFESIAGDIFQLGNTSYRIQKVGQSKVYVEDARGQPPNIPFWFGEAPGRTDELSAAVSELRARTDVWLAESEDTARERARNSLQLVSAAADQLVDYLAAARAALGALPTQETLVFERFFDEAGDQHLVIHSPYGSRINRAFGLALRKRFCRKFNFELQAAALEDTIVLSLGATHSFQLDDVARYLNSRTVRDVLSQALLAAPMFPTHWRWNATTALAIKRMRNGKRMPPQFQRSDAEDLMALIFPDQLACAENLAAGAREIPDHPLVHQTMTDCLHEIMDVEGLERLLARLERGEIKLVTRDLVSPSPLAQEVLNARPYAFLDDAPAEERRTLAVQSRGLMGVKDAAELGTLDPAAIARVREEAWPDARTADELYDALVVLGFMTVEEGTRGNWQALFDQLCEAGRATSCSPLPSGVSPREAEQAPEVKQFWVAAERLSEVQRLHPQAIFAPEIDALPTDAADRDSALRELVRSRLEGLGPVTATVLAASLGVAETELDIALSALEAEGFALRGGFTSASAVEWCDRRLLARIHRYTLKKLRAEIEPVSAADFMRFLVRWHGISERAEGPDALAAAIEQLEGYSIPAAAWERDILPARVGGYLSVMLDQLCTSGAVTWMRLVPPKAAQREDPQGITAKRAVAPVRATPIALLPRAHRRHWRALFPAPEIESISLSAAARQVATALQHDGASFFSDLVEGTGLLRTQVEEALSELAAWGLATADTFAGLRALVQPAHRRPRLAPRGRRRRASIGGLDNAGRWTLTHGPAIRFDDNRRLDTETLEHIAETLLLRYGVVFRKLLERETALPPWRELLYVYRRLEARGEIRGGRFVAGMSGEQFALPDAVGALREMRKQQPDGTLVSISAVDPLNLVGIILPGDRLAALAGNRILYRDGMPVACYAAGDVRFLAEVPPEGEWALRNHLLQHRHPAPAQQQRGSSTA